MGSLKEVRNRISSVRSTQQITKAMKVVAAAKLRKAQQRIVQMRPYAAKLKDMLQNLSGSLEGSDAAAYYDQRPVNRVLVIVVTSDRGLAGSFNSAVNKEAFRLIHEEYADQLRAGKVDIITVGRKARDFFRKAKLNVIQEENTIFGDLTYEAAEKVASLAMKEFLNKTYDKVEVIYNQFKNAAVYYTTVDHFLPVTAETGTEKAKSEKNFSVDYIFEPSKEEIVSQLVNQSLRVNFFRFLLDSNAAEHGARMTAMDKASDNAEEMLRSLRLQYNKERQATITKEILEIVGGAQALNG